MPRPFEVSVQSPVTVEQICGAFGSEKYWLDRFSEFGTSTTLDSLTVDDRGAITVSTVQDLRRDALPMLLSKVYPADLSIRGAEQWTPVGDGRVEGQIDISVSGAPGSGRGNAVLERRDNGSSLDVHGTVNFRVPLIGGKIETFLGRDFAQGIRKIHEFTTSWIQGQG